MNGVAHSYWKEVHDLRAPVADDRRSKRTVARRKKLIRTVTSSSRSLRRD